MNQFAIDVEKGLSSCPKYLSSKYFYDKTGDELFKQIMDLDEYYLTRSEFEILERYKDHLKMHLEVQDKSFELIEFGAGDGLKTKILLSHFLKHKTHFRYLPIDISENALNGLMNDLNSSFPDLNGKPINNDYFSALHNLDEFGSRKVVMFLGSNIGNFTPPKAQEFLRKMRKEMNPGDFALIGFDLKKDPELIRKAYNDSHGITRDFNLNLLRRINKELKADFNIADFTHDPVYDPETGAAKSYLTSLKDQCVTIRVLEKKFNFEEGERIFTEISQKYSIEEINTFAHTCGFRVVENFFDERKYFVDALWTVA